MIEPKVDQDFAMEARSALLDFYSSRAVAHASYFMASVFGMVALLALCQDIGNRFQSNEWWAWLAVLLWFGAYLIFALLGWWTLRKFGKYAFYADKLREHVFIRTSHLEKIQYDMDQKDRPKWERFFSDYITQLTEEVHTLRNQNKGDEAKSAEEKLEDAKRNQKQMLDEGKFSMKYFDINWGQEKGKIPSIVYGYVLVGGERLVSPLTILYWLLISFLAGLAFILIFVH